MTRLMPVTHVGGDFTPKCDSCKRHDPLADYVEDDETGVSWWECRYCTACNSVRPQLAGQQELDVGDAGAYDGVIVIEEAD